MLSEMTDPYVFLPASMLVTLAILLFSGFPVGFALGGVSVIFGLLGWAFDVFPIVTFFNFVPRIWGGVADNLIYTAIPMYILMGVMLERSGTANDLLDCLRILLRRVPGGIALAVTLMGTILAATTGIIGASVTMMTVITLPMMLKSNYAPWLATGTIAASATLGILIPPSIMLVIFGDLLSIPVGALFAAALIPGLVLSGLYLVFIFIICLACPRAAPVEQPTDEIGGRQLVLNVFVSLVAPGFLIFAVLGSILLGWATPTEAAGIGALGATFLAFVWRPAMRALLFGGITAPGLVPAAAGSGAYPAVGFFTSFWMENAEWRKTWSGVLHDSAHMIGVMFIIIIGATAFSFVFRALGGDDFVTDLVDATGLGSWGVLLLFMGIAFIMGFFFEWVEISLILLPLMLPMLPDMDFGTHVSPADVKLWIAILFAVNLQTSFLTPPFGVSLFYLKGAAGEMVRLQDIYRGIVPFVLVQLLGLTIAMAFPSLVLWLPKAIFN